MPGEQLACIWQAVYARAPSTSSSVIPETELKKLFSNDITGLKSVKFSEKRYNEFFKSTEVTFDLVKEYVWKELSSEGMHGSLMYDNIEKSCWEVCRGEYKSQLKENELMKLWKITNRLVIEESYPPVMSKDQCLWFYDKLSTILGIRWIMQEMYVPDFGLTFQQFIDQVENSIVKNVDYKAFAECIDEVHAWLVEEVLESGWMYKRTRKQANWTNWNRQWFELRPGKLQYFTSSSGDVTKDKKYKGEITIDGHCKLEQLPQSAGIMQCYPHRFKISNFPVLNCEFSVESEGMKKEWISSLADTIDCCKSRTTPIQRLIKQNHEVTRKIASSFEKIMDKLGIQILEQRGKQESVKRTGTSDTQKQKDGDDGLADLMKQEKEKIKGVFMQIDTDGNGLLNPPEFSKFLQDIGLEMTDQEANLVFKNVDKDGNGTINFEEFAAYFSRHILNESGGSEPAGSSALRKAFLQADRDGTGTLDFKELTEYVWEKNRSNRMTELMGVFQQMGTSDNDELNFDMFKDLCAKSEIALPSLLGQEENEEGDPLDAFNKQLKKSFDDTDTEDLAMYIRERWKSFDTFRRVGASGEVVMTGSEGMVGDVMPGDYNLIDLICFSDLPPLEPKQTIISNVEWISSRTPGESGKLILPDNFAGKIATDIATGELLRYYGCSFADAKQEKISLLYRHGIQDFTYENEYLSEYVKKTNGGAGIEKHEFSHLDCPLDDDSGFFILGKLDGKDLHVTAFHVPTRHTLYVPCGTIHSNDYLKGTWRTMLSDEVDIDHVHLVKNKDDKDTGEYQHIIFEFC